MTTTAYVTEEIAQAYFDERLDTEPWDSANSTDRGKALKMATRMINALNYIGEKTESDQDNAFPRYGDGEVPEEINNACCELALSLLDGVRPDEEINSLMVERLTMGNISTGYNNNIPVFVLAGIPNPTAWAYLKPHLRDWQSLELHRA